MAVPGPDGATSLPDHPARSNELELVFDLLFVFTISQLALSLAADHGWTGFARTVVLVALLWWTFGSYASLTRAPSTSVGRVLLVVGILSNFGLALSIPHALTADRLAFAVCFALVVSVHTALYILEWHDVSRAQAVHTCLVNAAAPVIVLLGVGVDSDRLLLWLTLAAAVEILLPALVQRIAPRWGGHAPVRLSQPDRFVHRHGVLLIVLLAQSVLTIGVGLGTALRDLDSEQVVVAITAVALAGTLYYAYFGERDDDAACRALEGMPTHRRDRIAVLSFGYGFALMLLGVDFAVVGVHDVLQRPDAVPALTFGGYLAGGVGVYWLGLGVFRMAIRRPFARSRILFGFAVGVFAFLGRLSGLAELLGLLAASVLMVTVEESAARRRLPSRLTAPAE